MDLRGKRVLVVGASGSIGSELTNLLVDQGAWVLGTASTQESSHRLRGDLPMRLLLDLESLQSIDAVADYITGQVDYLDGIVLASGLVAFGNLEETPQAVSERLMKVNFSGQTELVRRLLPIMRKSTSTGIESFVISISGVIAEQPMAGLSTYAASKSALHGYSIAASKELRKVGVNWIDARPGHTETGLASRAIFGKSPNFGTGLTTEFVAERIVNAILNEEKDLPSSSFKA